MYAPNSNTISTCLPAVAFAYSLFVLSKLRKTDSPVIYGVVLQIVSIASLSFSVSKIFTGFLICCEERRWLVQMICHCNATPVYRIWDHSFVGHSGAIVLFIMVYSLFPWSIVLRVPLVVLSNEMYRYDNVYWLLSELPRVTHLMNTELITIACYPSWVPVRNEVHHKLFIAHEYPM